VVPTSEQTGDATRRDGEEKELGTNGEQPERRSGDDGPVGPVSRRGLLAKGAGAAAAGIGLAVLAAEPAHAAPGDALRLGETNDAGSAETALVSTNPSTLLVSNNSPANSSGVGITARGRTLGIAGLQPESGGDGTGVIGQGAYGVQAIGRLVGLRAAGPVPLNLQPASTEGPPAAGAHIVGDVYNDARGHVYLCAAAGTPGTWVQPGFNPVNPFRVVDTRIGLGTPSSGPVGPGQEIEVAFWGVGGVVSGATAVVCNLTVTAPTAGGFLTGYPLGVPRPNVSNINFTAGQTIANQFTVKLGTDGRIRVYNASGSTHVIIDLAGFFY
jgi:hypothetical protein